MKHIKYVQYLIKHKWFVFIAGLKYNVPIWKLLIHDWTKFLPQEWIPYANYFYGDKEQWKNKFNIAWNHHQKANPHHWNYWVLVMDSGEIITLPMPYVYRREMLADWSGAGRAITGKWEVREWYIKNKYKIKLHPDTRDWIDAQLHILPDLEQIDTKLWPH